MQTSPVSLVLTTSPTAKGRARSTRSGHHYTPAATRAAEEEITILARRQLKGRTFPIFEKDIPVEMCVEFYRKRAKGLAKRYQWPTMKPDLDNYEKLLKDALSGIVYSDDSQVCQVIKRKRFVLEGKKEGIIVSIRELVERPDCPPLSFL